MAIPSPYLATNNLHFKPFCARIGRGVTWTTTALQQNASRTQWHGHAVRALSKVVLFAGAAICISVAIIESVSLFIICGLGVAMNKFFCNNRSEFLQKHTLKALSYALHSFAISIIFFIMGVKNPNLPFHTGHAIGDNLVHLAIAGAVQMVFGSILDRIAGRDPSLALNRTVNLLGDGHPHILNDVLAQVQRDFNTSLRDRMGEIPNWEEYLNRHPETRTFVRDLNVQRLMNDIPYRERALGFAREFLTEIRIIRPQQAGQADPLLVELNQSNAVESAYQDRLALLLKNSFLEIHRTPHLARCLDKGDDSGQDLLELLDAATYMPLTVFTQYKELLEPIQCPANFTGALVRYNPRREQLLAAKARVDALSEDDKRNLEQKILKGSDFEAEGEVQQAYLAISALAVALNQGPLMTKTALNLRNLNANNLANIVDTRNLFQSSCQQALEEIAAQEAPQPPA